MFRHWVKFKGVSSRQLRIIVNDLGFRRRAQQEREDVEVPFSDRSNVILYPHFKPYERTVRMTVPYSAVQHAHGWLHGYGRFETTIDKFRHFFASVIDIAKQDLYEQGVFLFTVTFLVDPFAFLDAGDEKIICPTSGLTFINPGTWTAPAKYRVLGSGNGTITVNDQVMTLTGINEYLTVDCDLKTVYKGQINEGQKMSGEFLGLLPGENTIQFAGGITNLEITPRWCEL